MGISRLRGLVATTLVVAFVAWGTAPATAGPVPNGSAGGCTTVKYKRVGGTFATSTVCSAPGSAFQMSGTGGGADAGCSYPVIKIFEDGTPHHDPNYPDGQHYITEPSPTRGTWMYLEKSDWHDFPVMENPPAGTSFDEWMATFPTYQEKAGGDRVFQAICLGESAQYWLYDDVTVPPTDPFWDNLPGQLAELAAEVPLASPSLAFTPGGPDVWGGFLTNAPYGVSLANHGIWHSVQRQKLDSREAWRLTVVASPVKATVIVKIGGQTEEMDCKLDEDGPVTLDGLPRFDPPTHPVKLPACAFTARWAEGASVSVSMRITYHVVGFINDLAQPFPDQTTISPVQTSPVVRAEAVNTKGQ
jgi:hypothetical protein